MVALKIIDDAVYQIGREIEGFFDHVVDSLKVHKPLSVERGEDLRLTFAAGRNISQERWR